MTKKKKPVKKKSTTKSLTLLNLKVDGKDRKKLLEMADKYANGNVSAWLRYAGSNHVPPKKAVIR